VIPLLADSLTIVHRDVIRTFRQKSQLYGSIARPLIWLFLLGNGLRGSFTALPGGFNYVQYIFPGMLAMNVLFASIMAGTSIIWDREFGFLKEILVAPVSRLSIVMGKTVSGSVTALIQGTIVLAFFPLLGLKLSPPQIGLTILAMWLMALAICSLGVLIASRMTSFEGFGTVNNFVVMPLFFLSGAMYPLQNLPHWLKLLVHANPVTYGVNLLRGVILGLPGDHLLSIVVITAFTMLVSAVSVLLFTLEGKGNK
jgi:ABC-2 type transport system permease protein